MLICGLFLLLASACRSEEPVAEAIEVDQLTFSMAETANVGEELIIVLNGDLPDGEGASLTLLGSYGVWLFESTFTQGKAVFVIPPEKSEQAGWTTVIGQAGDKEVKSGLELIPGEPAEPALPLIGPNTITADGKSWSIATLVPFDKFANPVAEGTEVIFRIFHPGNILEEVTVKTEHLLAWSRVTSKTKTGKTFITTQTENAYGEEVILHQTAGWPVPFTIENNPKRVTADGSQLTHVRSERIVDQYGNVIPDGSVVTFIVTDEQGRRRHIPSQTVDGFAITAIQAPLQPERFEVVATVFSVESESITIEFDPGPAVGEFEIDIYKGEAQYEGAYVFRAGPLLGERDQYVPNSTPVLFILTHENGQVKESKILSDDGYAVFTERIENMENGEYTIEAFVGTANGTATLDFEKERE